MFFLIALLVGFLGAGIVLLGPGERDNKFIVCVVLFIIYTLVGWWIFYAGMPSLAYPLFGWYGGVLLIFWVISTIVSFILGSMGYNDEFSFSHAAWFPIGGVLIVLFTSMSGCEILNWGKYSTLIGTITDKNERHWSQEIQPLDPTHIRLVPESLAISLAKTALSQNGSTLGSQFPLSEGYTTLQKIVDDYWYLIPLDFKGYKVWTNVNYVPGYVKISATDPYAKPILVTGKKMKYTPKAWFGDNLKRRLYAHYCNKILMDYSFEEDDSNHVYWVVTVAEPSISYYGLIVDGVVVFDPETGEQQFVAQKDIDSNPKYKWIDRVMPKEIISSYVNYWGDLKGGWWNSFWDHFNLLEGETPTMNYSSDGRCVFVTPVTSSSNKDQAMTGLMYTDARTGQSTYYMTSGGATEEAVVQSVNSAISYKKWDASEQIVYENVYGKLAALVPIMGQNGNYQGLAFVENDNKRVAIGTNPQEALVEFQKMLMGAGGQITTEVAKNIKEYTGKITRLGWDMSSTGKEYYIFFSGMRNSFLVSSDVQSELSLTQAGDEAYIKYINSGQVAMPVMYFENKTLALKTSKGEQSVTKQMLERKEAVQDKADVSDFKDKLNNMSEKDLKKLIELENNKQKK